MKQMNCSRSNLGGQESVHFPDKEWKGKAVERGKSGTKQWRMTRSSNIRNRSGRAFWEKGIAWIELRRWPSVTGRLFQMGTAHGILVGEK